jgi:hypothetical protein
VLVFLRLRGAAVELPGEVAAAGVLLSFALAELSYRLVERPLRVPGRIGRGQAFAGTAAVVAVCLAAGAALDLSGGLPARVPASALRLAAAADDVDPQRRTCRDLRAGTPEHAARCTFGAADRPVTYALVGDSHAASVRAGLEAALPGRRGVLHWDSGCAMLPGTALSGRTRGDVCERFREEALLAVERDPAIELVVLAGRWAYWLEGTRPEVSGSLTSALVDLAEPGADSRREAIFARALGRAVARLRAAGKRVVILGPTPEYGIDLPTVRALASWRGAGAPLSVTREAFERRNARALPALAGVAAAHGATLVRVEGALCDEAGCPSGTADRVFYYDTNHLTLTAARERLGPHLAAALATVTSTGASR